MSDKYNENYFSQRDYLDLNIATSIVILMRENSLKRLIDVGCGTGRLVQYLNENGFNAVGCDLYEWAINAARKINRRNTIIKASATKLPVKNESLDLVTAISVIEHLTDKEAKKFIYETHRILKPNGFIFLVTPNFASPVRYLLRRKWFGYSDPTHINFFTPRSLSYLLKNSGFKNVRLWFKTRCSESFESKFPGFFSKLPSSMQKFLVYLLFSTPFSLIRDSFWIAAQKNE